MWVNRHKLNNSLVVFIHGIFGSRWATWKGVPEILQRQFRSDPLIRSYDFFLFHYTTSPLRQPALDPHVIDYLDQFLTPLRPKYHTTTLIGHSQGGLLAKLYVLRELMAGRGDRLTVDLILTLGTPHQGLLLLNPLLWFRKLPLLGELMPLRQLVQLASRSVAIWRLKENWTERFVAPEPCSASATRRHVRSLAVVGVFDRIVREASAAGFPVDIRRYADATHPSLAKPTSESDALADLLLEELRSLHRPELNFGLIKDALAHHDKRDEYLREHRAAVRNIVSRARPDLGEDGVSIKTASLLMDFLYDFQQRPLRGLSLRDCVTTYATRHFEDEL